MSPPPSGPNWRGLPGTQAPRGLGPVSNSHAGTLWAGYSPAPLPDDRWTGPALAGSPLSCALSASPPLGTNLQTSPELACAHALHLSLAARGWLRGENARLGEPRAVTLPGSGTGLGSRPGGSKDSVYSHGLVLLRGALPWGSVPSGHLESRFSPPGAQRPRSSVQDQSHRLRHG